MLDDKVDIDEPDDHADADLPGDTFDATVIELGVSDYLNDTASILSRQPKGFY